MENEVDKIKSKFLSLKSREDVAGLLGIREKSLRYFLFKIRPENMYHRFEIPKKNGTLRRISAPNKELKEIQKKLAAVLMKVYEPKVCAYGFISGKNNVDNAVNHVKRNLILNIDLKDFFNQIHFGRIHGMLIKPPYSIGNEAAITIAQIACFNGVLPQGAPSSPILTNMICAPLDNNLMRLAKGTGCTYTRYADDITFSTYRKTIDESIVYIKNNQICIGKKLSTILKQHSFEVNPEKVSLKSHFFRQEVTGLTVNQFPNVRRGYVKHLRAILHHCEKDGVYEAAKKYVSNGFCKSKKIKALIDDTQKEKEVLAWFKNVLTGKISYIGQVKGDTSLTYLSFAQKLNMLFNESIFDVSLLNYLDTLISKNTFILEYDHVDDYTQGSGFYVDGIGIFTSYHVTQNEAFFNVFTHTSYQIKSLGKISKCLNEISSDKKIDYALYKPPFTPSASQSFKIGDSSKLKVGDLAIIVGFPNHQKGNSPYIQKCNITSAKYYHGALFYTISGRVVHGASGGVVLNMNFEVIGIIKGGISTFSEDASNENQGFVPIHLAIEHVGAIERVLCAH